LLADSPALESLIEERTPPFLYDIRDSFFKGLRVSLMRCAAPKLKLRAWALRSRSLISARNLAREHAWALS
jgi:hypothetical protein